MVNFLKFVVFNLFAVIASLSWSEDTVLEFYRDSTTQLTAQDIIDSDLNNQVEWRHVSRNNANFGFTDDAVWLRIQLSNKDIKPQKQHVRINYPMLDHVDAFLVKHLNSSIIKHTHFSDYLPFTEARQHDKYYLFSYTLLPQTDYTVYVRVETQSSMTLPVVVFSEDEYVQAKTIENYWFGALFGSLIIMGLYNLIIAISLHSLTYYLYVGYLSGFTLLIAALNGLGFQYVWSSYPNFNNLTPLIGAAWSLLFTLPLAYFFLKINRYSPIISILFKGLYALVGLSILSLFVIDYQTGSKLMNAMNIIISPVILITALYFAWHKRPGAAIFALAWLALVISLILLSLSIYNIIPSSAYTRQAFAVGGLLELVIISLALARRINESVHEKNQALLESELHLSKYQDIYHNSPAGIFTAKIDGSIANHNHAFAQIMELNHYESNELNIFQNLSKDPSAIIKLMEHLGAGRTVQGIPVLCTNGKQEERWLSITLSLQGEGVEQSIEGHITDIHDHMSRQQEKEEQHKKRLESLKLLIAGISHEINTPLGNNLTTLSFLNSIHQELTENSQPDQLDALNNLGDSFVILKKNEQKIDQLVKRFAMVSSGYLQASASKIYGKRFLEELTKNFIENTSNIPADLSINSHYQGPKSFISYQEPLTIIITGLIDNSIKHGLANSDQGQIDIELLVQEDHCEINYHDNGIGLKEDIKDQIFQPFFTTSRGKSETSGLGLYAIDNIVSNLFQGSLQIVDNDNGFHLSIQLPPVKLEDI